MTAGQSIERLAVGRLTALLDGGDLRYVELDGIEVVRRIYVTVRDLAWMTPEITKLHSTVERADGEIVVRILAHQEAAGVDLRWSAVASLAAGGDLSYAVDVEPQTEFDYNRIGLCVLHPPATHRGRPYVASGPEGEVSGVLPDLIEPQLITGEEILPLFDSFDTLDVDLVGVGECRLSFKGDLFEMEDQRNWSDGSLKTYCTPLSRPRPFGASPSETIRQQVDLAPVAARGARSGSRASTPELDAAPVELAAEAGPGVAMPELGVCAGLPFSAAQADRLGDLGPGHLRVDVRRATDIAALGDVARACEMLDCDLALALHVGEQEDDWLERLATVDLGDANLSRLMLFHSDMRVNSGPLFDAFRERLRQRFPDATLVGGTDGWFVDLNRSRPDLTAMDGVAWSITPGVHGLDEMTMVEAIEPQTDQLLTARDFCGELELIVGPLSLRPRYNPNAPDAAAQALEFPPDSIDPRQGEQFAAAWAVGSVGALAAGGAHAATYFEAIGPRGVVAEDGTPYPIWHVLRCCCKWRELALTPLRSSQPLRAQGFLVRSHDGSLAGGLLASFSPEPCQVRLPDVEAGLTQPFRLTQDGFVPCQDLSAFRSEALVDLGAQEVVLLEPA